LAGNCLVVQDANSQLIEMVAHPYNGSNSMPFRLIER
jgi:hypothetical protein